MNTKAILSYLHFNSKIQILFIWDNEKKDKGEDMENNSQ